jgi:hypothetical protein
LFVPATSASHGCLPAYNASLQGPSTSSDSQLSAYNASLQVQPTSSDSHTVNPGTGLPIMSTFTKPQYTSRVTDGIGDNASTNIRNKILLGEYIDLTREDDGCKNVDAPEPISTTETQASGSTDDLRLQPVTPLSKKKNEKKLVDGKYYTIFCSLQSV